ncbi:MAG: HNH endonuclease [Chloroflexota bacterium]
MSNLQHYAQLFANLRVNKNQHFFPDDTLRCAPHKPLLLLAVLDLYSEGLIHDSLVPLIPELGELFSRYWYRIMPPGNRPNLALPFFHLKNDGNFWHLVATPGNENVLENTKAFNSVPHLKDLVLGARLPADLSVHMSNPRDRDALRQVLTTRYFSSGAQARLLEQGTVNVEAFEYSQNLLSGRLVAEALEAQAYRPAARNQGFRRAIVIAYDHRCATCGIRVMTVDGRTAVDAAHIKPWSESRNDRPTNGLALCKLCHWCFDEGVLGIDQSRAILISRQLQASSNVPAHLATLQQRPIIGPANPELAPDLTALIWHQRHVFLSA